MRAAAIDAAHGGYRIVALDAFGDRDLRAVCAAWAPLQPRDRWPPVVDGRCAAVVPTGGFRWPHQPAGQHGAEPGGATSGRATVLVAAPPAAQLDALGDPAVLAQLARRCQVDFPATFPASAGRAAAITDPDQWLVKPRLGGGGRGIWSLADRLARGPMSNAAGTASAATQSWRDVWLQRRTAGRLIGANFLARWRRGCRQVRLLGVCGGLTYRRQPPWRWLYGGSFGPLALPSDGQLQGTLMLLGDALAERFDLVGLFNLDAIVQGDGRVCLLEVNPRYSASMELLTATAAESTRPAADRQRHVSLIDWHVAAYQERLGRVDTAEADRRTEWDVRPLALTVPAGCKRILYARRPIRSRFDVAELRRCAAAAIDQPCSVTLHDLPWCDWQDPAASCWIPAGQPALTVIVRGRQRPAALLRGSGRVVSRLRGLLANRG